MSEEVPGFAEACARFRAFLASQGVTGALNWAFREDVCAHNGDLCVRQPLPDGNAALARRLYDIGRVRGLGVWLNVVAVVDGRPLCFVWVPADEEDASYAMLAGLKLSVPVRPLTAVPISGAIRWWVLRWRDRHRRHDGLAHQLPSRAEAW